MLVTVVLLIAATTVEQVMTQEQASQYASSIFPTWRKTESVKLVLFSVFLCCLPVLTRSFHSFEFASASVCVGVSVCICVCVFVCLCVGVCSAVVCRPYGCVCKCASVCVRGCM